MIWDVQITDNPQLLPETAQALVENIDSIGGNVTLLNNGVPWM